MAKPMMEDMELESGLADDFDGVIVDTRFDMPREEYTAKAGSSDPWLILTLESPELDTPQEQGYSTGSAKQWQIGKGGQEITSARNPDSHRFNMNSRAGMLVSRIFQLVGEGDRKKGQEFFLSRGYYMTEAPFHTGLNFHWKRESLPVVGGGTSEALMPNAYLGEAKGVATPTRAAAAEVSDEDVVRIQALAEGKAERELKSACLKESDLKDNKALMNMIFNKGLLKNLEAEGKLTVGPDGKYV